MGTDAPGTRGSSPSLPAVAAALHWVSRPGRKAGGMQHFSPRCPARKEPTRCGCSPGRLECGTARHPPLPAAARSHFRRRRPRASPARAAPGAFLGGHPRARRPALLSASRGRAKAGRLAKCAASGGAAWPRCGCSWKPGRRRSPPSCACAPGRSWSKWECAAGPLA